VQGGSPGVLKVISVSGRKSEGEHFWKKRSRKNGPPVEEVEVRETTRNRQDHTWSDYFSRGKGASLAANGGSPNMKDSLQ